MYSVGFVFCWVNGIPPFCLDGGMFGSAGRGLRVTGAPHAGQLFASSGTFEPH